MNTSPPFSPLGAPPGPSTAAPAPATLRGSRGIPLIAPPESRVIDLAEAAHARGCRLVHDGRNVLVVPRVMPGQFVIAEAA
jgi:hypothetical protein